MFSLCLLLFCSLSSLVETKILVITAPRSGSTWFANFFTGACELHEDPNCEKNYKTWYTLIAQYITWGNGGEIKELTKPGTMERILSDLRNTSNIVIVLWRNPFERFASDVNVRFKNLEWWNLINQTAKYDGTLSYKELLEFEEADRWRFPTFVSVFKPMIDFYINYEDVTKECLEVLEQRLNVTLNHSTFVYRTNHQSCEEKLIYLDAPQKGPEILARCRKRNQFFEQMMVGKNKDHCLYWDAEVSKPNGVDRSTSVALS